MILAGDIGGTHARLALFQESGEFQIVKEAKYSSKSHKSLEEIIHLFLQEHRANVQSASFGVAGAVREGKCQATNLPWTVDAQKLKEELKIPIVHIMNDLEANAYGIRCVSVDELFVIHQGHKQLGNQALIAAGTGLGEAGVYWDGKRLYPFACEGGHCDFAPRNTEEYELYLFLQRRFRHVSYERVVSGPGILSIYQFLTETGRFKAEPEILHQMHERDPSSVITEYGTNILDPACTAAVDMFISIYGAEAGNLALKFLALGGFYIGGGIAPHLAERIKSGAFHASFIDKGRFSELLSSIPIYLIMNSKTALLGAAAYARGL